MLFASSAHSAKKKLLLDARVISDNEASALRHLNGMVNNTDSVLRLVQESVDVPKFSDFFQEKVATGKPLDDEVMTHIQELTNALSAAIISDNRKTAWIKSACLALNELRVDTMMEYYVDRDPVRSSFITAFSTGLLCMFDESKTEGERSPTAAVCQETAKRTAELLMLQGANLNPTEDGAVTPSCSQEDQENEEEFAGEESSGADEPVAAKKAGGLGTSGKQAAGEEPTPSPSRPSKRQKTLNPDHHHFGIVNYWRTEAPDLQAQIEKCFTQMECKYKSHSVADIYFAKWNKFFWVPKKGSRNALDNWPRMINRIKCWLPDPVVFTLDKKPDNKHYDKFLTLHEKLRSPMMLAAAWECTHTIYPNVDQFPSMGEYLNGRKSRLSQLRKLWMEYSKVIRQLVADGLLAAEAIVNPSLPIPSKCQHPWDLKNTDDLERELAIADKDATRNWYLEDLRKNPFNRIIGQKRPADGTSEEEPLSKRPHSLAKDPTDNDTM
jgi:hypothetical protein